MFPVADVQVGVDEIIEVISPVTSPLFNTSKYKVTESDGLVNPTLYEIVVPFTTGFVYVAVPVFEFVFVVELFKLISQFDAFTLALPWIDSVSLNAAYATVNVTIDMISIAIKVAPIFYLFYYNVSSFLYTSIFLIILYTYI